MLASSQVHTLKLDVHAMAKFKVYGVRTPCFELVASE